MLHLLRVLLSLALLIAISGCRTNNFLMFYEGQRLPTTNAAIVVRQPPLGAIELGRSNFVSAQGDGDGDAVAAAIAVGADFVQWAAKYATSTSQVVSLPMSSPSTSTSTFNGSMWQPQGGTTYYSGTVQTSSNQTAYVPYSVTHHWFQYSATFYRRGTRAAAPPTQHPAEDAAPWYEAVELQEPDRRPRAP